MVASGLTLIFGIMGVINLAHGSFYMVGAYLALFLYQLTGGFLWNLLLGSVMGLAVGWVLEWLFFSYLYKRDHLQQVLMSFGLILIIDELRKITMGNQFHSIPTPPILDYKIALGADLTYPIYNIFIAVVGLIMAIVMALAIKYTKIGYTIRAVAENQPNAILMGVNGKILYRIIFAVGIFLAVLAGMVAAPQSTIYPGMGQQMLIMSFVVVVIGGIGNIRGTFYAAIFIGFVSVFGKLLLQGYAGSLIYFIMAIALLRKRVA